MLRVIVELHDARNGEVSNLAVMTITNDGTGDAELGNYDICLVAGSEELPRRKRAEVRNHPRAYIHGPWPLVAKALKALGYGGTV